MKQALTELRAMMNTPIKAYTPNSCLQTPQVIGSSQNSDAVSDGVNTNNSAEFSSSTDGSAIEGSAGSVESSPENRTPSATSGDTRTPEDTGGAVQEVHDGDLPGQITRVLGKSMTSYLLH